MFLFMLDKTQKKNDSQAMCYGKARVVQISNPNIEKCKLLKAYARGSFFCRVEIHCGSFRQFRVMKCEVS